MRTFRLRARALVALSLCIPFAGCVDGSVLAGPEDTFRVPVALAPVFMESVTDLPPAPITRVRLEAVDLSDGRIVGAATHPVNPDDDTWLVEVAVEVPAYRELRTQVLVVLMSGDDATPVEEWSGRTGELILDASTPDRSVRTLPVYRGPPANLDVTALDVRPTGAVVDGRRTGLEFDVTGATTGARVFLRSLDPGLLAVDGDGLVGLGVGSARLIAEAGPVVDTVLVDVRPLPIPPQAEIEKSAGPGLADGGTRLLGHLADAAGAAAIAGGMRAIEQAIAAGAGGDIVRAIADTRELIRNYNDGDWGPDGPDLSLVLHALDVLERTLDAIPGGDQGS